MSKKRKNYAAGFKSNVAIEALKEELTLQELSSKFGIHSNQISHWKKRAGEILKEGFTRHRAGSVKEQENWLRSCILNFCPENGGKFTPSRAAFGRNGPESVQDTLTSPEIPVKYGCRL